MAKGRPRKDASAKRLTPEQQELASKYVLFARSLAKPYKRKFPELRNQLDSAALFGLVQAVQTYNKDRNIKFATFARYRILGAVRDAQRECIPKGYWKSPSEKYPDIKGLTFESEVKGTVLNVSPNEDHTLGSESTEWMLNLFSKLPRLERFICEQLYIHGKLQSEIAAEIGKSRSRVSYLHLAAITELKDHISHSEEPRPC